MIAVSIKPTWAVGSSAPACHLVSAMVAAEAPKLQGWIVCTSAETTSLHGNTTSSTRRNSPFNTGHTAVSCKNFQNDNRMPQLDDYSQCGDSRFISSPSYLSWLFIGRSEATTRQTTCGWQRRRCDFQILCFRKKGRVHVPRLVSSLQSETVRCWSDQQ